MEVIKTNIDGVVIIEPRIFEEWRKIPQKFLTDEIRQESRFQTQPFNVYS